MANEPKIEVKRPLPKGTIIEYCGEVATVLEDRGFNLVVDDGDGQPIRWQWEAYGIECEVISLPEGD